MKSPRCRGVLWRRTLVKGAEYARECLCACVRVVYVVRRVFGQCWGANFCFLGVENDCQERGDKGGRRKYLGR